tara:strand:- start:472 stop:801 length:330 start_codon:yes stop_codon:yes gene_type:complete
MIWPPVKAWTSKICINNQVHFVAINYGGELKKRWVVLMSVLDSSVVVKVSWSQLVDSSNWDSGWTEMNYVKISKLINSKIDDKTREFSHPSNDSGLTIPITRNSIRPWF